MTPAQQAYCQRVKRLYPVGTTYGRLTITGYRRRNDGVWLLICRCSCGKKKVIDHACHLRNGLVKSCGCLNRELASKRRLGKPPACKLPAGQAGLHLMLRSYKLHAKRRNLPFELTDSAFFKLTQQPCTYCGKPPEARNQAGNYNKGCVVNGVDRQDTLIGYTVHNSVSCCKQCNRAKYRMSVQEFKAWIVRVVTHSKINISF